MKGHIVALSFGAGVQSTALLELILREDSRLLDAMGHLPEMVIFADTQWETLRTLENVWKYASRCTKKGIKFIVATQGDLGRDFLQGSRAASIPAFAKRGNHARAAPLRRNCTRDYKVRAIARALRESVGIGYGKRMTHTADVWIGISVDEIERMKQETRIKWQTRQHPLIEMNWRRSTCLEYLRSVDVPLPDKSACVFCPYHNNRFWFELKTKQPREWQRAVEYDRQIRDHYKTGLFGIQNPLYLHRSLMPLDEAPIGERQLDLVDMLGECDGMCGV